jgi:hypothetical protein
MLGFHYGTCSAKHWSIVAFKIILFSNAIANIRSKLMFYNR